MDIKYSWYRSTKGYKIEGGTAAQFLKADGSVDSTAYDKGYKALYSFTNGCLIKTTIAETENLMFNIFIEGNSYNSGDAPTFARIQAYKYLANNSILGTSALTAGLNVNIEIFVFEGFVHLWFPQETTFRTVLVKVVDNSGKDRLNWVSNAAMPSTGVTQKVTITPKTIINSTILNSTLNNYIPKTGGDLTGGLNFPYQGARINLGLTGSGDVHIGSSGFGAPSNGTSDYGAYIGHNVFRDTDGLWKHSRTNTVGAYLFKLGFGEGSSSTQGFSWLHSPNVGTNNVSLTELMKLDISGNLQATSFKKAGGTNDRVLLAGGGDKLISDFAPASANLASINQNLGTTNSPTFADLTVSKSPGSTVAIGTGAQAGSTAAPKTMNLDFMGYGNIVKARISSYDASSNTVIAPLIFSTYKSSGFDEDMRIMNGNVGIGVTNPGQKLDVNGNVRATSFIKSGGTATQFLKADGSVDSNSYINTSHVANGITSTNINNWNYAADNGIIKNVIYSSNSGYAVLLSDNNIGGEAGLIDNDTEIIIAGIENNLYKFGTPIGGSGGVIVDPTTGAMGYGGVDPTSSQRHYFNGTIRITDGIYSEQTDSGKDVYSGSGDLLRLNSEIERSGSELRYQPYSGKFSGTSNVFDTDHRDIRIILLDGGTVTMVQQYAYQQILIMNPSDNDATFVINGTAVSVIIPSKASATFEVDEDGEVWMIRLDEGYCGLVS